MGVGIAVMLIAVTFWYGLELVVKLRNRARGEVGEVKQEEDQGKENAPTPLSERIKMVMTETRVVLPGAQALLGFQFAATLTEAFDKLPPLLKQVHLASLGLVALAVIFLMAPAAYHRIVENGEDTEGVHRFASRMVLAAMAVLAPGVCGDLFVVAAKVFGSVTSASMLALGTLALFYGFWFGYMVYARSKRQAAPPPMDMKQAKAA
jgi:hypothetical protein